MKTPIITYNDIKFYDLDEVEDHMIELIENTQEYKKFHRFIHQAINESNKLYEMAYSRSEFIKECSRKSDNVHYTIANIICLEDICPEMVNHWRKELLAFTDKIINKETDKSVKKGKLVSESLIAGYTDHYKDGYSYLDALVYEDAMKEEIKKASKSKDKDQQIVSKYIKYDILLYIDTFVNPNKDRVYNLFNRLIEACDKSKVSIFKNALNDFINYNNK